MGGWCPALHVSRVDRAAQPGAMGAPSYVQPDHWDQAAHQLFTGAKRLRTSWSLQKLTFAFLSNVIY